MCEPFISLSVEGGRKREVRRGSEGGRGERSRHSSNSKNEMARKKRLEKKNHRVER